jgi:tripartite-type tricarboxylate transporter receptor subunit TctC
MSPIEMPTMTRRQSISRLGLACSAWPALAEAQPRLEAVRIVCGYPPGGSVDIVSRKLAEKLVGRYAAQCVVENKPGAAGRLAVEEIKRAPADGSVLLVTPASTVTMYPHIYRQLAYDVFTDLAPVSELAATRFALAVGPKVPAAVTDFDGFIRWCKAEANAAQCANAGAGSMPHFMAMLLARETGVPLAHIPYRGGTAAMQGAAAGEVAAALSTEAGARAFEQAGKLRVLATTWPQRSPYYPQAPSFRELGLPKLVQREWFGVFMPGRAPQRGVDAASQAIQSMAQDADVRDTWDKIGLALETSTPSSLATQLRSEHDFWGPVVHASGFTPES